TALQTSALIFLGAATPAEAATSGAPQTGTAQPQTTVSTQPSTVIKVNQANQPSTESSNIVVTGSRIRRPNLESVVPVTSIQGEKFFQTGQTSVGDAFNALP